MWRVQTHILLWRQGWAWPAAVVLMVAAAATHWLVLQPVRESLAATRAELSREQVAAHARPAPSRAVPEAKQLAATRAVLQQAPQAAELVLRISGMAQAEQIALPQSEYVQQFHTTTQVHQAHVTQSVRASYPQLRRYIEAVLRDIPSASLDQVTVRRDNVGQSQLEVRLRWSLWMQQRTSP
jgi:hypothetical protein